MVSERGWRMRKSSWRFGFCPRRTRREFFSNLIRDLAARFDAPIFEPHVTLHGGVMTAERAAQVLTRSPLDDHCDCGSSGVAFSEEFTKTLFVQFHPSAEAKELSARNRDCHWCWQRRISFRSASEFDLCAHVRSGEDRIGAGNRNAIPSRSMFDSLQAIVCPAQIKERADVEAWRFMPARPLERRAP